MVGDGVKRAVTRLGIEPRTYGLKVKKTRSPSAESRGKTGTSQPTEGNEKV